MNLMASQKSPLLCNPIFTLFLFTCYISFTLINSNPLASNTKPKQLETIGEKASSNLVKKSQSNLGTVPTDPNKILEESQKEFSNSNSARINGVKTSILIDPTELSCDIKFIEIASFSFDPPTDIIYYTVVSPRNPFYNFGVKVVDYSEEDFSDDVKLSHFDIYLDKDFKEKSFIDQYNNQVSFRERWVIAVTLNKPVSNAELMFSYYSERAILINKANQSNLLKVTMFNPYNQPIKNEIMMRMTGFSMLSNQRLQIPSDSKLREFTYKRGKVVYDNGYEISTEKIIQPFTQYECLLSLPEEISSCDSGILNYVYYGLIGITSLFVIGSLITVFHIYKE